MPTGVGDVRVRVRVRGNVLTGDWAHVPRRAVCPYHALHDSHAIRFRDAGSLYLSIYLNYPRLESLGLLALLGLEILVVQALAIPEAAVL